MFYAFGDDVAFEENNTNAQNLIWSMLSSRVSSARQKIMSLQFNRIEQCCTAHIIDSCQQY